MRFLLVLFCVGLALAQPQKPVFPNQYTLRYFVSLPYASITEQVDLSYDAVFGATRYDYYGGLDSYLSLSSTNMTYHIYPLYNTTGCFNIPGPVEVQSALPDLTPFTFVATKTCPSQNPSSTQQCNVWQYVNVIGSRQNTYTFYADASTNAPVWYTMMGYDSLFGSHYDEYEVQYGPLQVGPVPASQFQAPTSNDCRPFPGASGMRQDEAWAAMNPTHDVNFQPHVPKEDHVERVFKGFARKHRKQYSNNVERAKRKSVFQKNMRMINAINRQQRSYKVAINHMADMTREERFGLLGTRPPVASGNGARGIHTPKAEALPEQFDWRPLGAVSAVKDQGICGSCWSFGSHQSIEGAHFLKTGKLVRLSSQAFVDCSWAQGNTGCDGGNDYLAYQWALQMNGGNIPTEESYPYLMADGLCHADRAVAGATITGWMNVTSGDEQALMDAVVTQGPISVSIDASHDSLSFYSSGVYSDPQCGNTLDALDHTVLLVGYTDINGVGTWIIKNSWSTHYGDQGYIYIQRAGNMCGVATAPTYVTM